MEVAVAAIIPFGGPSLCLLLPNITEEVSLSNPCSREGEKLYGLPEVRLSGHQKLP